MTLDKNTVAFLWDKLLDLPRLDLLKAILDADKPEEFAQMLDAIGGPQAIGKSMSSKLYAHVVKDRSASAPPSSLLARGFEFLMEMGLPLEVELKESGHSHTTDFAPISSFMRDFAYNSYSSFNSTPRAANWAGLLKVLDVATNVYPGVRVSMDYRPVTSKDFGHWDYTAFNKRVKASYASTSAPGDVVGSPSILLVALQHGLPQMKPWLMERAPEIGQLSPVEAIAVSECGDFDLVMEYLPQAPEVPFVCLPRLHKTLQPQQFDRVLELLRDYPLSMGDFTGGPLSSFASRLSEFDVKSMRLCVDAGITVISPDSELSKEVLARAVSGGNLPLVEHFLDEGMSASLVFGREGLSLLHRARTPEVARLLIERGASIHSEIRVNVGAYSYRDELPKNDGMPVAFYWANNLNDEQGPQMLALAQECGADLSDRFGGRTMLQHISTKNLAMKAALKSLQASGAVVGAMGRAPGDAAPESEAPRRRGGLAL